MHAVVRGLKKIRGAISLAVLWSVSWMLLGALIGVARPIEGNSPSVRLTIATMAYCGVWGAFAGLVYASCLALEQARTFREISYRRGMLWGALSGLVVPLGLALGAMVVSIPQSFGASHVAWLLGFACSGALCGVGTLAIARRADASNSSTTLPPTERRALRAATSRASSIVQRMREVVRPWLNILHVSPGSSNWQRFKAALVTG